MLAWPSNIPCVKLKPCPVLVYAVWTSAPGRARAVEVLAATRREVPARVVEPDENADGGTGSDKAAGAWPEGAGADGACMHTVRLLLDSENLAKSQQG